jgi:hypothetical protein
MQATDIGTLIIKSSDTLGGRPRILALLVLEFLCNELQLGTKWD